MHNVRDETVSTTQTEATENEHAALMEQTLFDTEKKRGIVHGGKCVIYFHRCPGVLIKMSNERVSGAAPQRIHSHTMHMQTQNSQKEIYGTKCKHSTQKERAFKSTRKIICMFHGN